MHYMFQSFKSVVDNFRKKHGTSMNCKVCGKYNTMLDLDKTRTASQYEETAYMVMRRTAFAQEDWIADARVLLGNGSSVDIWIPALDLCVMVDGEGHFFDQFGKPVFRQEETDDDFNYDAVGKGFSVLRLHYKDHHAFSPLLLNIIDEFGGKPKTRPFLHWSPAFKLARQTL